MRTRWEPVCLSLVTCGLGCAPTDAVRGRVSAEPADRGTACTVLGPACACCGQWAQEVPGG